VHSPRSQRKRRHDADRHPGDGHPAEGLRGATRQALQRERSTHLRADVEHPNSAQQVQEADPGHHAHDRDGQAEREARPGTKPMKRLVTLVLSAALLGSGVFGAWAYAHNYYLYRGFNPPHDPSGVKAGTLRTVRFFSPALGRQRSYQIYLPAGYSAAAAHGARFPVLYMLHGSPGAPDLLTTVGAAGVSLDTLIARHAVKPFIVVMPDGRDGSFRSATEWANTPHGRYESLVLDTVRAVDKRWATKPDRAHRGIAGLSSGGFAAVNIALHNLGTFSLAESWSGYFQQSAQGPFRHASAQTIQANSPARYVSSMRLQLQRQPLSAFLYGGSHDRGSRAIAPFAAQLRAAGGHVATATYPGGHDWALWRTSMPISLRYAAGHIGAGQVGFPL
jgi:enterochelin esterase-like enzyme